MCHAECLLAVVVRPLMALDKFSPQASKNTLNPSSNKNTLNAVWMSECLMAVAVRALWDKAGVYSGMPDGYQRMPRGSCGLESSRKTMVCIEFDNCQALNSRPG